MRRRFLSWLFVSAILLGLAIGTYSGPALSAPDPTSTPPPSDSVPPLTPPLLEPTPGVEKPNAPQYNYIAIAVDRGDGSHYRIGEAIRMCYSVPRAGNMRILKYTSSGTSVVLQGRDDGNGGCISSTVGSPTGQHTLRIEMLDGGGESAQTYYYVDGSSGGGMISISVDRGTGATYRIGDAIRICYTVPRAGNMRILKITSAGTEVWIQARDDGRGGCTDGTVGAPSGRHTYRIEMLDGGGESATTYFDVAGPPLSIRVNRGEGSTYRVGESLEACYTVPRAGNMRITKTTRDGTTTIREGRDDGTGGCIPGTAGTPTGWHTLRIQMLEGGSETAETFYYVTLDVDTEPPAGMCRVRWVSASSSCSGDFGLDRPYAQSLISNYSSYQPNSVVDFGPFEPGVPLVFYLNAPNSPCSARHLSTSSNARVTQLGTNHWSIAWEDLPANRTDSDYNDLVVDIECGLPLPCNPGNDGVVLYEHPNYQGRCVTFTGDDIDFGDNNFNDIASAIEFRGSYASGWEAQLFEHTYYGGTSSTFRGSDPDLGDDAIGHDRASSIRIRRQTYTIAGAVRDDGSFAGIAGAAVTINSGTTLVNLTTDSSGYYETTSLPAGTYTVSVYKAGYERPSDRTLTVPPSFTHLDFFLSRATYTIGGRVTDDAGSALAGVTVNLSGPTNSSATTGSDGRYTYTGLPAGTYSVSVVKSGYTAPSSQSVTLPPSNSNVNFVLTRPLPATPTPTPTFTRTSTPTRTPTRTPTSALTRTPTATSLPVSACRPGLGADLVTDFAGATGALAGYVRVGNRQGTTGSPLTNAEVRINGQTSRATRTDGQGVYSFDNLPTGDYELFISENGYTTIRREVTISPACIIQNIVTCPTQQWVGEYFGDRTLSGSPAMIRCDNNIDFYWGQGSPGGSVGVDNFSVRWLRDVSFEATGNYRFRTFTDDGVRLYIDNQRTINDWTARTFDEQSTVHFINQGTHQLKLEYVEWSYEAMAHFNWYRCDGDCSVAESIDPQYQTHYRNNPMPTTCDNLANQTIAAWGCLITSVSMALQSVGIQTTPVELNTWLSALDTDGTPRGYTGDACTGNLANDSVIKFAEEKGKNLEWVFTDDAVSVLRDKHLPVILQVGSGNNTHFLLAVDVAFKLGTNETILGVNDPHHAWACYAVSAGSAPPSSSLQCTVGPLKHAITDLEEAQYRGRPFASRYLRERTRARTASLQLDVSGAEVLLVDAQGRRTGYDQLTGQIINEIPEARYFSSNITPPGGQASGMTQHTLYIPYDAANTYSLQVINPNPLAALSEPASAQPFDITMVGFDAAFRQTDTRLSGTVTSGHPVDYGVTFTPGQNISVAPRSYSVFLPSLLKGERTSTSDREDGRIIEVGQTVMGQIMPASDVDDLYFDAQAGTRVSISLVHTGGNLDGYLTLYAPDGRVVASDDDSGEGYDPLIQAVLLPQSGRYRIRAQGYSYATTGDYTLTVSLAP